MAGLGASIDFVNKNGIANALEHERALAARLTQALAGDDRFTVLGSNDASRRGGVVAFTAEGLAPAELGTILDESFQVAVRPGLHCAPYIHKELGTFPDGAVRVSPGHFNTAEEIDTLIDALQQVVL